MRLLPRVFSWLLGVRKVPEGCPTPAVPLSEEFPKPRPVPALAQAKTIISLLQDEGLTGVVPRGEILTRYAEHCYGWGFIPVKHNALCEAIGILCKRVRPVVNGHKITAYEVPATRPAGVNVFMIPNGNNGAEIPFDLPKRARTGTSAHA